MDGAKMTASELADLIGMCGDGGYNQDAATMLRQQQAEIEALKQIIDANNLSQNIGQFVKPTNEPVGYYYAKACIDIRDCSEQMKRNGIPLYTHQYERPHNTVLVPCDKLAEMQAEIETLKAHPVKELDEQFKKGFEAGKEEGWKAHKFHHPVKELGYNDIMGTWWETMPNAKSCEGVFEFAKEILRKASEK